MLFAPYWVGKGSRVQASWRLAQRHLWGIGVLPNEAGVPEVMLHGGEKAAAVAKKIPKIHLSLSYSDVSFSSRSLEELV